MKLIGLQNLVTYIEVVPYIGTWIETHGEPFVAEFEAVVPYIGTWIETREMFGIICKCNVVPYIGTWIETRNFRAMSLVGMSYLI